MNLQSPSACNTGQNFILFFINVSIARKAPVNDTIPILLHYKNMHSIKIMLLCRERLSYRLQKQPFLTSSAESQFTLLLLLLKYKLFPSFSKPILAPATEGSRSTFISINTGRACLHRICTILGFYTLKISSQIPEDFLVAMNPVRQKILQQQQSRELLKRKKNYYVEVWTQGRQRSNCNLSLAVQQSSFS